MTYLRHRYLVVFAILLLAVICLQGAVGGYRGLTHKCCHGKVFLKRDRGHQLMPVVFLSTLYFEPVVLPVRRMHRVFYFSHGMAAVISRPALLRGPPCG